MDINKLGWDMSKDGTCAEVMYNGQVVMRLGVESIIEGASRTYVLNHVIECDNTPWLRRWQEENQEAHEAGMEKVVNILRGIS